MLYTNELAVSLPADFQRRSPVSVFASHACTTSPFRTVKLNNNNKRINSIKNVTRCRDSSSAKAYKQGRGDSIKQFSIQPTLHIFPHQRYVGWSCVLNSFVLSSLPCFCAVCWSAIPTSCYILNHFILVHVAYF